MSRHSSTDKAIATKRAKRQPLLKAQAIVEGGAAIGEIALQKTAEDVSQQLLKDPPLLQLVKSMLDQNLLHSVLCSSMECAEAAPPDPKQNRKLRQGCTKWKHLPKSYAEELFEFLEPGVVADYQVDVHGDLHHVLGHMLHFNLETFMPHKWHPECWFVSDLLHYCQHRYKQLGSGLAGSLLANRLKYWELPPEECAVRLTVGHEQCRLPLWLKVLPPDAELRNDDSMTCVLVSQSMGLQLNLLDFAANSNPDVLQGMEQHLFSDEEAWSAPSASESSMPPRSSFGAAASSCESLIVTPDAKKMKPAGGPSKSVSKSQLQDALFDKLSGDGSAKTRLPDL